MSTIIIEHGDEGRFFVPRYKLQQFATVEDFDAHITSANYKRKINGEMKDGVCLGVQDFTLESEPNKYNIALHWPDKKLNNPLGYSQAIPD